jgi:Cu(I)/Ag(I) efflux system membrane fusion protein
LLAFYAPDLLAAQQSYLFALGTEERFREARDGDEEAAPPSRTYGKSNLQVARDTLRNMGMEPWQIEQIGRTRAFEYNVVLTSPVNGFVLARNVSPDMRFERGQELFRIADLGRIWILADVFENEVQYFRPGTVAQANLRAGGKSFTAVMSEVPPVFDQATRTMKLRLTANNPGMMLRPDMFVDVELPIKLPESITVPVDAVLDSGVSKRVFVDRGSHQFEARTVETGWRYGDRVQILSGVNEGERIVVSGMFLVDSETRLQTPAAVQVAHVIKDVVCGMSMDEGRAQALGHKLEVHDRTLYFCSEKCKQQFERSPQKYLGEPGEIREGGPVHKASAKPDHELPRSQARAQP